MRRMRRRKGDDRARPLQHAGTHHFGPPTTVEDMSVTESEKVIG